MKIALIAMYMDFFYGLHYLGSKRKAPPLTSDVIPEFCCNMRLLLMHSALQEGGAQTNKEGVSRDMINSRDFVVVHI